MATTLHIESFSDINLRERTALTVAADVGDTTLTLDSTAGYAADDIIYVGNLSREGCEKAVIDSVDDGTTVTLAAALTLAHDPFEPVMSVLGDKIRIYRAANVDGTAPDDDDFSVLATRDIDPDQLSTYYTDSGGSSNYWYKFTYYNVSSSDETDLGDSDGVRGDDYGHYASLTEIRSEAGFSNNYNVKDSFVAQQREAAEDEINAALASAYTTPFSPVPDMIHTLTIQLAAGLLLQAEYGSNSSKGKDKLTDARAKLKALVEKSMTITDAEGNSLADSGVDSYFGEEDRSFTIGMRF